ncbi:hypothetical protein BH11MYX3_BH11MYX3_36270 [soil metagenome]
MSRGDLLGELAEDLLLRHELAEGPDRLHEVIVVQL